MCGIERVEEHRAGTEAGLLSLHGWIHCLATSHGFSKLTWMMSTAPASIDSFH
jgi:hypothetical protein